MSSSEQLSAAAVTNSHIPDRIPNGLVTFNAVVRARAVCENRARKSSRSSNWQRLHQITRAVAQRLVMQAFKAFRISVLILSLLSLL
jgi:hypothetical protein